MGAAPRVYGWRGDGVAFARPVNREKTVVRPSSDARGYGTRGVELWDASPGMGDSSFVPS